MNAYKYFLEILDGAIAKAGNANRLANSTGMTSNIIFRWRSEGRIPGLDSIQPILDYMGIDFFPKDSLKKTDLEEENASLRKKIKDLEEENARLTVYRYKWEGYIESLQAGARNEPD